MGLKDSFVRHLIWPRPRGSKDRKSSSQGLELSLANIQEPVTGPAMAPQPSPAVEAVPSREPTLEKPTPDGKEDPPTQSEERIQVKQLNSMTEAIGYAGQPAQAEPRPPEQAPQQATQPKDTGSSSSITDDLRQLFEEAQTGNEELKKLAESLEDVDIRSLAKECSVVAARLKSRWGNR